MDEDRAATTAREFIKNQFDPYEGIAAGLAHGMERAGKLYEEEEYYISRVSRVCPTLSK